MTRRQLELSLALWRRRHRWNERKRAKARKRKDEKAARKYGTRLGECVRMIERRKKQLADLAAKRTSRQKAVRYAAGFIGLTEKPPGSNRHPGTIIDRCQQRFGMLGVPWCGCFAGDVLVTAGVKGVTSRVASVALIEQDARAHRGPFRGWTTDPSQVRRGDLCVVGGYGVHVELVERAVENGGSINIGGNTSPGSAGSQANGGGVWRRHRSASEVYGWALVDYPER